MFACVSVDIDETHHYHAIHGLPPPRGDAARVAFRRAVPRIVAFAAEQRIPLTLFVVSDDLASNDNLRAVGDAQDRGASIESHSASHRYDLVRLPDAEIAREVISSFDDIARRLGKRPEGFRAPGYNVSRAVFDAIESVGARFDSSVFPCPAYYAAKMAAIARIWAGGGSSTSTFGDPRWLFAPSSPYVPSRTRGFAAGSPRRRFLEIPIQVSKFARLPIIGTTLALAGHRGVSLLLAGLRPSLWNLTFHAIDFADGREVSPDLRRVSRELAVPLDERLAIYRKVFDSVRASGYAFASMREAARAHVA